MAIRKYSNPRELDLSIGLQEVLRKNGMQAHISLAKDGGRELIVLGHDSPVLTYKLNEKQVEDLMGWGSTYENKKAYNTFASIVKNDFYMPQNFVSASNAFGRVAMGLHGYRIGHGEYGYDICEELFLFQVKRNKFAESFVTLHPQNNKTKDIMPNSNPLAEVFGFPVSNETESAKYYRENRLCPYHNRFPNCTKDKADNPLGVCSVYHGENKVITCPSRFREDWKILQNAASFVWPKGTKWTSLPEIKLVDANGQSAGNVDYVIVSYNEEGQITDFASIEVQGVYISGNLRNPFQEYMKSPASDFEWEGKCPHPDYLSSSRKRLIPQMLYKGGIFKAWGKKQCVVIQKSFFDTLPPIPQTTKEKADIAWFLYDLEYSKADKRNHLVLVDTVYTEFQAALEKVIYTKPGEMSDFLAQLQEKLDKNISNEPETHSVYELL